MKIIALFFLVNLISCSYIKKEDRPIPPVGIELTNSAEFESKEALLLEKAIYAPMEEVNPGVATVEPSSPSDQVEGEYIVQENETLMMIAFKLYGDFYKWKDIRNRNKAIIKGDTVIDKGMVLKYLVPEKAFAWNPEGIPYLIKKGDFLSRISNHVYGTPKRWVDLWNNNKILIKDPNKIYVGLTLYYLNLKKIRTIATEKKK